MRDASSNREVEKILNNLFQIWKFCRISKNPGGDYRIQSKNMIIIKLLRYLRDNSKTFPEKGDYFLHSLKIGIYVMYLFAYKSMFQTFVSVQVDLRY